MPSLHAIYASTSGHTEYVVSVLLSYLRKDGLKDSEIQRVEQAGIEDLSRGDILLLASGTWNTGGIEGQLNPHMHDFLGKRAAKVDLHGRKLALIGLGDARYRYTCRAAAHLEAFVESHGGKLVLPTLRIVNEPYGQEAKIQKWGQKLLRNFSTP